MLPLLEPKPAGRVFIATPATGVPSRFLSAAVPGPRWRLLQPVPTSIRGYEGVKGLHIIADLYGCRNRDILTASTNLREICVSACRDVGLTVLGDHFYQFDGLDSTQVGGATGAVVFAESHLAVHTWPERDGATLDVYVCNVTCDNSAKAEALYARLAAAFEPTEALVERVWRGRDQPPLQKKKRLAAVK